MPTMRTLRQPGPVHPNRIDCCRGDSVPLRYALAAGLTLNEAVTGPLVEAGFQCGTVVLRDVAVRPFRYVMPGPADDESHVAYFSAPRAPAGVTRIERANVTFGWADGKPFIHCHAVWREADGRRRGGHILPRETVIAEAGEASAWGFRGVRIEATPDPETNFTLFQPSGGECRARPGGSGQAERGHPGRAGVDRDARRRGAGQPGELDRRVVRGWRAGRGSRDRGPGARGLHPRRGRARWTCWWWTCGARCMRAGCSAAKTPSASRSTCSWKRAA